MTGCTVWQEDGDIKLKYEALYIEEMPEWERPGDTPLHPISEYPWWGCCYCLLPNGEWWERGAHFKTKEAALDTTSKRAGWYMRVAKKAVLECIA